MDQKIQNTHISQKELKIRSMKQMREKLKLNIGSRKCLNFLKEVRKGPLSSDEEIQTTKSDKLKESAESLHFKSDEDPEKFEEKYKILNKIGEGSNGVVHRCINTCTGRIYAVKQSRCDVQHMNSIKESYIFTKKLKHENIIKYRALYIDSQKRKANLVMELFNHPQLSKAPLTDEKQLRNIAKDILGAVAELHKNGVCHRDIKPDNILYDQKNKKLKIVDMGISKHVGVKKSHKNMMTCTGTLFYKAPQMFKGGFYDEVIDQWAVGVSLYKLVCGRTPFQSDYVSTTIKNIENGFFSFEDKVWKSYSYFCKDLIKRLISPRQIRLTAEEALNHLWFQGSSCLMKSIIQMRRNGKQNERNFQYDSLLCRIDAETSSEPIKIKELKLSVLAGDLMDSDYIDSSEDEEDVKSVRFEEVKSVHFKPESIKL